MSTPATESAETPNKQVGAGLQAGTDVTWGLMVQAEFHADIRREHNGHYHEANSAMATTQKMPPAYSPTEELAKPMGKNRRRHQGTH